IHIEISRAFFNGASELAATDAHPRPRKRINKKDVRVFVSRCLKTTANETWKIYSHDCGHPFVDHVSLRAWHSFKGGTGKNQVQQQISEIGRGTCTRCE